MTGIAAIHHPLRKIDPRAGHVEPIIKVGHLIYGPAVHAHPHSNVRMVLERPGNFHRAMHRLLGALEKDERHAVAARNTDQFSGRAAFAELRRVAHNVVELLQHLALLVHQQLRVTHHVNEQDVRSFQMSRLFSGTGHGRE